MNDQTLEKLRYPIGRFEWESEMTQKSFEFHKKKIADYPNELGDKIKHLSKADLKKPYRSGGWQIAQLIHHIADSHTHNYIRFKQALLVDTPTIMDYKPADWATTADATLEDISGSLQIIKGIHQRWSILLNSIKLEDLQRSYYHPNRDKYYPLHVALALYSWHGDHHLAHIENTP
tara:strand:- start:489 stop:1016 length:528 start_codon:yes stop_codon:yes gene_type:complete